MTVSTNPYTSVSITGYNSNPPPDDGTTGADNLLTWDKHKTKLGDPIKSLAESVNTNVLSAMAKGINADAGERNQIDSSLAFAWATATIGNSIATPVSSAAYLSGATTDTLFELKTGSVYDGAVCTIKTLSASDSITVIHATATGAATATSANIYLRNQTNRTLDSQYKTLTLHYDSGVASGWVEDNTATVDHVAINNGSLATCTATAVDFSDLPSDTKKITIMFSSVSLSGTDDLLVQFGGATGIETDAYVSGSGSFEITPTIALANATTGFNIIMGSAGLTLTAKMEIVLMDSTNNTWVAGHTGTFVPGSSSACAGAGSKSLADTLTQLRITTDGSNTFDAGTVNIQYQG